MRFGLAIAVLLAAGCGPEAESPNRTCGGVEPVLLLEDAEVALTSYAGDRVLVVASREFPFDISTAEYFAVGTCGEDPVALGPIDLDSPLDHSTAGPHVLRTDLEGDLSWVDSLGQRGEHPLFPSVASCVISVADGLVAQSADGRLLFHPDPSRPDLSPRVVGEGLLQPDSLRPPSFGRRCSEFDTERPVADGAGVLFAEEAGPLVRVALPSGEREVLVPGPVGEFATLDDPRYLLWRGGSEHGEPDDCCRVHVLDRLTGRSDVVGGGVLVSDVDWEGLWIENWSPHESVGIRVTLRHVVTGHSFSLDGSWDLQAELSSSELLLFSASEGTQVLDTTSGDLEPLDFPELSWPHRSYDDGIVGLAKADSDDARGDLLVLRYGSRNPQVQARGVPEEWVRTRSGNVVFIDRDDAQDVGSLVLVEVDGRRTELASGVSGFEVPDHGTALERNEVLYTVSDGVERGLWRFVLP